MADDTIAGEATDAPITRSDFQGFVHQLGGTLNQIAAQNQFLAQRLEQQAQAAAAPPQEPDLPPDFDKSMALEILRRPRDYSRKMIEAATAQASQIFEQRMQQEYARAQQDAALRTFWSQFYEANPDLRGLEGQVWAEFQGTNPQEDPSVRANHARDVVRNKLQERSAQATDAEQRQRAQRQLAAGAPGSQVAQPAGGGAAGTVESGGMEYGPSSDLTAEYLLERRQRQAARNADQLRNDREYWEEMKQARLRRQDQVAAKRPGSRAA